MPEPDPPNVRLVELREQLAKVETIAGGVRYEFHEEPGGVRIVDRVFRVDGSAVAPPHHRIAEQGRGATAQVQTAEIVGVLAALGQPRS